MAVGPPAYNNWRGAYWGYHQGWANGYWHGYHNSPTGAGAAFALGAAAGVTAWALGSSFYYWGYASYANPYYATETVAQPIVIEQTVVGGEPQTVTVPAVSYDYSPAHRHAGAAPRAGRRRPGRGEVRRGSRRVQATATTPRPSRTPTRRIKVASERCDSPRVPGPGSVRASEVRASRGAALCRTLGRAGVGLDDLVGLYPRADVYTAQLRELERIVTANPRSSAGRFVLAYHYLTQGHNDAAVGQFQQVQTLAPGDTLSAQLLKQLSPPEETPAPAATSSPPAPPGPAKQGNLAGRWTAKPNAETAIDLGIKEDGTFSWTVTTRGKPQVIAGDWSLTGSVLTLAQGNQGSALVGNITWQAEDRFQFRALGTTADDPGLLFTH